MLTFKEFSDFTMRMFEEEDIVKRPNGSEAIAFLKKMTESKDKTAVLVTEKGVHILKVMRTNKNDFSNLFKARDISESLFISSRSVSGSMRKLVTDGYVEKTDGNPASYSLTELGETVEID